MARERRSKYGNDAVDNASLASSLAQKATEITSNATDIFETKNTAFQHNIQIKGANLFVTKTPGRPPFERNYQEIDTFAGLHGSHIFLYTTLLFDSVTANTFVEDVTVAELKTHIDYCISKGISPILKVHIANNYKTGAAHFNPADYQAASPIAFFDAYKAKLLEYAAASVEKGLKYLCISNEIRKMTTVTYTQQWRDIINTLKTEYPSLQLISAMTYNEFIDESVLLNLIDIIGWNMYPALTSNTNATVQDILYYWRKTTNGIDFRQMALRTKNKYKKPIWITEVGCVNNSNALVNTATNNGGVTDWNVMARYLKATFAYWANTGIVEGIFLFSMNPDEGFNFQGSEVTKKVAKEFFSVGNQNLPIYKEKNFIGRVLNYDELMNLQYKEKYANQNDPYVLVDENVNLNHKVLFFPPSADKATGTHLIYSIPLKQQLDVNKVYKARMRVRRRGTVSTAQIRIAMTVAPDKKFGYVRKNLSEISDVVYDEFEFYITTKRTGDGTTDIAQTSWLNINIMCLKDVADVNTGGFLLDTLYIEEVKQIFSYLGSDNAVYEFEPDTTSPYGLKLKQRKSAYLDFYSWD